MEEIMIDEMILSCSKKVANITTVERHLLGTKLSPR